MARKAGKSDSGADYEAARREVVDNVGQALADDYGWMVEEAAEDGGTLNVWKDRKSGYEQLTVCAFTVDRDDGSGSFVFTFGQSDRDEEGYDVVVTLRDRKPVDLEELNDALTTYFGGSPKKKRKG